MTASKRKNDDDKETINPKAIKKTLAKAEKKAPAKAEKKDVEPAKGNPKPRNTNTVLVQLSNKPIETYQLDITLERTEPAVKRSISVPSNFNFRQLANIMVDAFSWGCPHQYLYESGEGMMGKPDEFMKDLVDDSKVTLAEYFNKGFFGLDWEFNMGESWHHEIILAKKFESNEPFASFISGQNQVPPEDVGGEPGFELFKEAINNKKHPEHTAMKEWALVMGIKKYDFKEMKLKPKTMLRDTGFY